MFYKKNFCLALNVGQKFFYSAGFPWWMSVRFYCWAVLCEWHRLCAWWLCPSPRRFAAITDLPHQPRDTQTHKADDQQ